MHTATAPTTRSVIHIARLLDQAGEYNRRAKSCPRHHAGGLYRRKDRILAEVLRESPEQFTVDSVLQRDPAILGVSHLHTERRFHIRLDRLPADVQEVLHRMREDVEADALVPDCDDQCRGGAA